MSREYTRLISVLGTTPSHGPFIYHDDFEHLLKWTKYAGVGDAIYELDPTIAYSKNQSLYLKTRTTGAAEDDQIGTLMYLYMTPPKKLNYAFHFRSPDFTKIKKIRFYFILLDGVNRHYPTIIFYPNTPQWQYHDSADAPQNIANAIYPLQNLAWHRVQLLADLNSDKYIALKIDSRYYDLSAFSLYHPTAGTPMHLYVHIDMYTIGASPCEMHIDDFLIHEL